MTQNLDKRHFIVCADYGMAWGWTDGCCCNEFIDDREGNELKINKTISDEFEQWQQNFECGLDNPNFDWDTFNAEGKQLTAKLQRHIGDLYDEVIYEPPFE